VLDVVVPVHNEEVDLEPCVRRLHAYLSATFPYRFRLSRALASGRLPLAAIRGRLSRDPLGRDQHAPSAAG